MNSQRGQATAVVIGVAALVVLTLAGLGFYAYRNPTFSLYGKNDENRPVPQAPLGSNGTSTIGTTGTSTIAIASSTTSTRTSQSSGSGTAARRQVASASQSFSGPAYRNPTFGLSVPGSYQVVPTVATYGGVPTTASYAFYQGGAYAYTINVFSKEQWNNIRIQETVNVKEGTGPDYLGEGRYLGENKTWIFSVIYGSYQPSGVSFHY